MRILSLKISLFLAALLSMNAVLLISANAQEAKRSIEPVTGDVYRFQNNFHVAMFVVTEDGIVVTDPIDKEAVAWLKEELAGRFGKPVTHMILSHTHADHASGGQEWGQIEVIAHENAATNIKNGAAETATPTVTFTDTYNFSAGGKTFELTYLGKGHGNDMIATVVRPENVGFIVDVVSPKRLPFRDFPGADIDGYIDQIAKAESLDFEILVPGHSGNGTKADAAEAREYMEKLRTGVLQALKDGKSVDEIKSSDLMSEYSSWIAYDDFRELNIEGMARWLQQTGQAG